MDTLAAAAAAAAFTAGLYGLTGIFMPGTPDDVSVAPCQPKTHPGAHRKTRCSPRPARGRSSEACLGHSRYRSKKHNWEYPPGQRPTQQGEAYVKAIHHLVEAHDEEDQVHFHYSDEIDRICGAFDDMKAVELRQVLEGTHDGLLELLNSLIVEPARERQSVRADIPATAAGRRGSVRE